MGQGLLSQSKIPAFLSLWLGAALLYGGLYFQEVPLRLAGQAKFPSPQAFIWQQTQADVSIAAEDKIKSTIDTYFIIINESLKTLELLDFGFLFDLNDVNAWNDYAYERGSMHVRVEANRAMDQPLISYAYKPKYFSIKISGASADVSMSGSADWIIKEDWGAMPSPWHEHKFSLAFLNGQWRIKRARCLDVEHNTYPRDTDFNKAAEEAVIALKKHKKHDPSAIRKSADPRRSFTIE